MEFIAQVRQDFFYIWLSSTSENIEKILSVAIIITN